MILKLKRFIALFSALLIIFSFSSCTKSEKDGTMLLEKTDTYKVFSNEYTQVDAKGQSGKKVRRWRDGFVTGNGENGAINAGSPYDDTLIYQNVYFIMPNEFIRESEDISYRLEDVRQAIVNGESYITEDEVWNSFYCFHPGAQLRIKQEKQKCLDYIRWCDYETAEAVVKYQDKNGIWERRTFTSRTDNATITKISKSSDGTKVNLTLSIDDISKMYRNREAGAEELLKYKKLVSENADYIAQIAHYPSYEESELKNAGYSTLTYVITQGGTKERIVEEETKEEINVGVDQNPAIKITDADAVYLITISDRDLDMGTFDEFDNASEYNLISDLYSRCVEIEDKYSSDQFSYEKALEPSAKEQSSLFNAVSFNLGDASDDDLSNEELLSLQRKSDTLNSSMVERAYNSGRYAMICCSGYDSVSRLYGLWTGEWAPRWNGGYTMDANVNLQSSAMNSANCISYGESYIRFILNQIDDWKINALHNYGFENAIQAPGGTDGALAQTIEYSTMYAFDYWNHGTAWMLQPIYEFYQTYGNVTVETSQGNLRLLEDILYPLLQLNVNFWEQLLTPEYYTDENGGIHYEKGKKTLNDGEYYCIIPGYSPENTPANKESGRTANCTADISAARKSFDMLIQVEKDIDENAFSEDIDKWKKMSEKLPKYLYDDTGAIKEWAALMYDENNEHRHISHLYCAWPSNEVRDDKELASACLQAIENRNNAGNKSEETQTHGWLHKGLVAARLKDTQQVEKCLYTIFESDVYYTSMLTDHNTDRSSDSYCMDTELGILGVIDEMLLYSDTGVIEIMPAMINDLQQGNVKGLMSKTQAQVDIEWKDGLVTAQITSNTDQTIQISCASSTPQKVKFEKGEMKTFEFSM